MRPNNRLKITSAPGKMEARLQLKRGVFCGRVASLERQEMARMKFEVERSGTTNTW